VAKTKLRDEQNPLGYFNFADAYLEAARALSVADNPRRVPHRQMPVSFLYYQAIELFLKAFLRLHKVSTTKLASKELGHKLGALAKQANGFGLRIKGLDTAALKFLDRTDAIENSRYIRAGTGHLIPHVKLDQICRGFDSR
jgi:HEPN domain-containing protein